jgi:hypothetical protein
MLSSLIFFVFSNSAQAKCEGYVRKAATSKGKFVIQNFKKAHACDPDVAKNNFFEFMKSANDLETLQRFTLTAIQLDPLLWEVAGSIPGKIPDYSIRNSLTKNLGKECSENAELRTFMKASYATMGGTTFNQWDDAYINCDHEDINTWIVQQVEVPPKQKFSDKYNTLLDVLGKKKKTAALTHFQVAAISAAQEGPYKDILRRISETVAPPIGGTISPEDKKILETTLLSIAQKVDKSKANDVAYQLAAAGSEDKAAQLLPTIYAEQYNDGFTYGVAALELAKCKGDKKEAVIHFAELEDKKVVWSVREKATATLSKSKPKLSKCESEGDWSIVLTSSPVQDAKAIKVWASKLNEEYSGKGYKVKLQKEKKITIE